MKLNTASDQEFLVLIVTGLSGAGKTSVMRSLEDANFYCVDNLPVPLIFTLLNLIIQTKPNTVKVALGIDARGGEQYLQNFLVEVSNLKQSSSFSQLKIVFLNASEETLIKRFQETRRNHPLLNQKRDLIAAIREEARLLKPIMAIADIILDTDIFNIHELRNWVRQSFEPQKQPRILVNLISFGFKYGIPTESNLVFDIRFLANPYFVAELKNLTGRDTKVQEYIFSKPDIMHYWQILEKFIRTTLAKYCEEGRYFVTIAIGCTGGKHRSVSFVEKLAHATWPHTTILTHHRDITKE